LPCLLFSTGCDPTKPNTTATSTETNTATTETETDTHTIDTNIPSVHIVEYNNPGVLCWDAFNLIANMNLCLSSSCDTLEDQYCNAEIKGDRLLVETYARIEHMGGECTDDCYNPTRLCFSRNAIEDNEIKYIIFGESEIPLSDIQNCPYSHP